MVQISVTRLRLRSYWYLLPFILYSVRSQKQAREADGCLRAIVRRARGAFWTLTAWRDRPALRAFMVTGVHARAMPKLKTWCDEASLAHWEQDTSELPSWTDAERHLKEEGRTSALNHPTPAHAAGLTLGENGQ